MIYGKFKTSYIAIRRFLGVRQLDGRLCYYCNQWFEGGSLLPHSKDVVVQLKILNKIIKTDSTS